MIASFASALRGGGSCLLELGGFMRRVEGEREGGKEGRREGGKEGRREGGKEGRREGGKEGRREGRKGWRGGFQGWDLAGELGILLYELGF